MSTYDFTPPHPELMQQWRAAASNVPATYSETGVRFDYIDYIATRAARWGYEQCLGQYELGAMGIVLPTGEMLGGDDAWRATAQDRPLAPQWPEAWPKYGSLVKRQGTCRRACSEPRAMEVNEEKEMKLEKFFLDLFIGALYGAVFIFFLLLIAAVFDAEQRPENQFKVVAEYKGCEVVQFLDPSQRYQYLLHCPK